MNFPYLSKKSLQQLSFQKSQFYVSLDYLERRRKKTVILLSVGNNVHQDPKIRYLSNDSFKS